MRRIVTRLFMTAIGCLLVTHPVFAQGAVQLEPVAEGVWAVRRAYAGSNAAVIVGSEGLVVIDSHVTPAGAADTLAAIRGITDLPVRFVVDTHWHTDHSVGAAAYLEEYPDIEVIAHHTVREDLPEFGPEQMEISVTYVERALERAEERLAGDLDPWDEPWTAGSRASVEHFIADQRQELGSLTSMALTLPTLTLERKLVIHREEGPVELLFLGRGHTRGDIVAWLPEQKVLVAGDLVTTPQLYVGSHSRPGEWVDVLRMLGELDIEHIVPGHGEVVRGKDYLSAVTEALAWVVNQVGEGIEAGLGYEEIAARTTLDGMLAELGPAHPEATVVFEKLGSMIENATGRAFLELSGRLDSEGED